MTAAFQPPITEKEAIEILQEMEARFDLLQYKVDGWCFWPLLRYDVAMEMVRLPLTAKGRFTRFQQLLIAIKDLPIFFKLPHKKFAVKTYSSARSYEENGMMKDVFFDDLLDGFDEAFRIESINNKAMFLSRWKAKTRVDSTSLPIEIAAGLLSLLPWISPDFSVIAEKISITLSNELHQSRFTPKRILRKARFFYWGKKIYRWLLSRIGAEKVLTADPAEFLISSAAKEIGLPVIEFQHGLVSREYNMSYSWNAYARHYKEFMPLSNVMLLFGEHWREELLKSNYWDEELHVTGRIVLDSFRTKVSKAENEKCNIVFTSQGLETEKLIRLFQEFTALAEADKGFDYHLFIKLHPIYDPDKLMYQNQLGHLSKVTILEGDEEPSTFKLLSQADFHWTISSSCHYDAIGMGVPTVILGLQTYETVMALHEDGYAFLARDGRELFNVVRNWKNVSVSNEIRDYFYRPGALENARKEIGLS